jgi:tetratricopeptide (TPR) repeat protein
MKLPFILFLALYLSLTCALSVGAVTTIPAGTPPPGEEDSQGIAAGDQETIVPEGARISGEEAMLALARALAREEATQAEARRIFQALIKERPDDPGLLADLADLALASGHAEECRDLYLRALALESTEARRFDYADRMSAWGDFYGAERIYREFLAAHPEEREIRLKLAGVLVAMQRTEEAEGLYRKMLLHEPNDGDVLFAMVRLKMAEKDFIAAETWVRRAVETSVERSESRLFLGNVLVELHRYDEARMAYREATAAGSVLAATLGIGRSYMKEGMPESARQMFAQAMKAAPDDVEARFRAAGPEKIAEENFIREILRTEGSLHRLEHWAGLYAAEGRRKEAVQIYEFVLSRDPAFSSAQVELAEILALDQRFDRAINMYVEIAARFPGASKILIGQARALGWAKRYSESLDLYKQVHRLNSRDPVPVREMARTALWGKLYTESSTAYGQLFSPPVDQSFQEVLISAARGLRNERLMAAIRNLMKSSELGSVTEGYERFRNDFEIFGQTLSREDWRVIEGILLDFLPAWRIQKAAALERMAKKLVRDKRPGRSFPVYRNLIAFEPWNEEARFDLAQVLCSLGLCNREKEIYQELIEIDPLHALAGRALKNQEILNRPALSLTGSAWGEKGRGDLSQINRFQAGLGLDLPVSGQYHLRFNFSDWIEQPRYNGTSYSYSAYGPSLEVAGVFSPVVKAEAGWTLKDYVNESLASRHTGFGRLFFNVRDAAVLGLGVERKDEISNLFGLRQGVQSDTWLISARSDLTRKLDISGTARWLEYSDGNRGIHDSLNLGYDFTEHPRIFRVILSGDYRDTLENNDYRYRFGQLSDIIHPYWTPEHNKAGGVILEWHHDLSKEFFCGNELHYYEIKLSFGTDSESNRSVQFDAEWHYELKKRLTVGLRGMIHRSREWDANSLQGEVSWRF